VFPSSPPPLAGIVHIDVRVDRARWHVATAGDAGAPPVVLLHGWPQHWWEWRKVIPELAKTHRVYAPDMRGFGWSDAPAGVYSKMGLASDVERLLDVLELDTCVLVGHDWGGFVGWLTAIRAPERIERLVALSIIHPWFVPDRDLKAALSTTYQLPLATPVLGAALMRAVPAAIRTLVRKGAASGYRFSDEDVRLYADAFRRPDHARAASALYRTFLTRELPAMARGRYANRRVEVPVVTATGAMDPVITPARLAGAEEHASILQSSVIEGAGHFLPEERPGEVADLILGR